MRLEHRKQVEELEELKAMEAQEIPSSKQLKTARKQQENS